MNATVKLIVVTAVFIRLAIMPISFHPDIKGHYLGAWLIAHQGQFLGLYDYISKLPRPDPMVTIYNDNFFVYQPVTYWLHAAWLLISHPLIPWEIYEDFELNTDIAKQSPLFPRLMFTLKLPYLIADLILLLVLLKISPRERKNLLGILWSANIPLIHSAYMMGQFDVFVALGIAAALLAALRNHPHLASAVLAISAGFKPFPLLMIPFLPGKVIHNLLVGGAVYALIIFPYALLSPGYRLYALVAEHSDKMWYAKIPVSGSQSLPLFMVGFGVLFWLRYYCCHKLKESVWLMSPLLLFYSLTHFHPQWFAWLSPLLITTLINHPEVKMLILAMFLCYLAILFSFDPSLHLGLFGFQDIAFNNLLTDKNISLIRGFLAATAIVTLLKLIKSNAHFPK